MVVCKAGSSDASMGATKVPESREEAVAQACTCIAAQLKTKKKAKAFSGGSTGLRRLLVEVPLSSESSKQYAELGLEFAKQLSALELGTMTYVYFDTQAAQLAAAAADKPNNVVIASLESARGQALTGTLVLVCPSEKQIEEASKLVANWLGTLCVGINAAWDADRAPPDQRSFVRTFTVVYSFLPLAIQFFLSKKEGAVFKFGAEPWRIFSQQTDGTLKQVAQQAQRRPNQDDLELAFLNQSAAESPLTAAAKGFRSTLDKLTKKDRK